MKLLQNQPKLIQIESRLKKESYLSRGTLPASSDAKMFLFLESIKSNICLIQGYPDRKMYPNLYHWYILMKQFATSSLEKWIANADQNDEDQLIEDFISRRNQKILADAQTLKKNISQNLTDDHGKTLKPEQFTTNNCNEIQYIMDLKIKEGTKSNMKQLIVDFLEQEQQYFSQFRLEVPDVQQLVEQRRVRPECNQFVEQRRVRIVAKMDPEKYEEVKNKISALEGVETFESKKKDKRFMTANTTNNFLSEI